ncbi:MAG: O-antigen ligase family protein [bacterium]
MPQKFYTWILKGGVLFAFLTPFFVFNNLLFPYITSKQIPFNIIVEIMVVFWAVLLVKYPKYRLKKNWITISMAAFFAALLVSALLGVDFNLSFWGDIERMLGVFHLLHFFLLYLIIITVFRTDLDWQILIMGLVGSATLEAIYAVANVSVNNYGTLGNSSYISGQMIFGIFFAIYLMYKHRNWAAWLGYLGAIAFMFTAFANAGTRGAFVGLAFGLGLIAFLTAIYAANKKVKYTAFGFIGFVVVLTSLIFANKDAAWVNSNKFFLRVSQIDFASGTFQTRLYSWKAAGKDFPNHPFFGTGYGNFAISFDKYLDPKFFSFEATYFDHAHNNLVDIGSTTGLVGLITYLLMFVAMGYYLITLQKNKKIDRGSIAVIWGLIAAYFIQNIVLFDSFVTYFALMVLFGLVYWYSNQDDGVEAKDQPTNNAEFVTWLVVGSLMLFITWQYNINTWKMLIKTIDGQIAMSQTGDLNNVISAYKEAYTYGSPLDRDSRTSLIQLMAQQSPSLSKMSKDKAVAIIDYVENLNYLNLAYNPNDSFNLMMAAQLYNSFANYYGQSGDMAKYNSYLSKAETSIDRAIETNPARPTNYFFKAQLFMNRGKKDEAVQWLEKAVALNPDYPESSCQLGRVNLYLGKDKAAYKALNTCIDKNGVFNLQSDQMQQIAKHYYETKDYKRTAIIYEYQASVTPKDGRVWAALADIYRLDGNIDKAIASAIKAGEADPKLKSSADKFIENLRK